MSMWSRIPFKSYFKITGAFGVASGIAVGTLWASGDFWYGYFSEDPVHKYMPTVAKKIVQAAAVGAVAMPFIPVLLPAGLLYLRYDPEAAAIRSVVGTAKSAIDTARSTWRIRVEN